jgi:hypothetical protein
MKRSASGAAPGAAEAAAPAGEGKEAPRQKRGWASWNVNETKTFFEVLLRDGRDFDNLRSHIPSKSREQVRLPVATFLLTVSGAALLLPLPEED